MHNNGGSKLADDGQRFARTAHLRYVTGEQDGISRRMNGHGFKYVDSRGKKITHDSILKRIKSLVIPPAWRDVWICPLENGHLQATGRDDRGRKQYRYHPRWREARDDTKYNRVLAFAKAVPHIRRQVARDLKAPARSKRQVLAAVVQLLEVSLIRVGNKEYERENHSYGLTTMKNRHAHIHGSTIAFHFRGKSGKEHTVEIHDARLAKIVSNCRDLPGQDLFQYVDESGHRQNVRSEDVNEYLGEISGGDFTAKDFRTFAGTVLAGIALQEFAAFESLAQAKRNVVQAIESVAARLGNTKAICKKSYIHPEILNGYLQGATIEAVRVRAEQELKAKHHRLRPEEAAVVAFLEKRLAQQVEPLEKLLRKSIKRVKKK